MTQGTADLLVSLLCQGKSWSGFLLEVILRHVEEKEMMWETSMASPRTGSA